MMLNLSNVEELVFHDKSLRKLLPEFASTFGQWDLARQGGLRSLGRRAVMDFLSDVTDEHMLIMEQHFSTSITIDKVDYHIAQHRDFALDEAEAGLNSQQGYESFCVHRDENRLYVSFWR